MNWFSLLLIFKLVAHNWAAPIDLFEINNTDLQPEEEFLKHLNNKTFNFPHKTSILNETWADTSNSTERAFDVSSFTEYFAPNMDRTAKDLKDISLEIQKELDENIEKGSEPFTEMTTQELSSTEEMLGVEEIANGVQNTGKNTMERAEVFQKISNSSHDTSPLNISLNTGMGQPGITTAASEIDNSTNGSLNSLGGMENEKSLIQKSEKERIMDSTSRHQQDFDNSTDLNEVDSEHINHQSETISKETTLNTEAELEMTTNIPATLENLPENSADNQPHEFITSITESPSKKLSNIYDSNRDREILASTDIPLKDLIPTKKNETMPQNSSLSSGNLQRSAKQDKIFINSTAHHEIQSEIEAENAENGSSASNGLKSTIDSFVNQLTDISGSLEKATEETEMNSTAASNFNASETPVEWYEKTSETDSITDLKSEDISEKADVFEEAIDSFIEDVLEIGNKLSLIPKETTNEPVPVTIEPLTEKVDQEMRKLYTDATTSMSMSNLENLLNITSYKVFENSYPEATTADSPKRQEEVSTTTPSFLEILRDEHQKEAVKTFNNSQISISLGNLVGAASSKFEKTLPEYISTNQNKSEAVIEMSNINEETTSKIEVSSTLKPVQDFHANTENISIEDQRELEILTTTQIPIRNTPIPNHITKIAEENVTDHPSIYKDINAPEQQENVYEQHLGEITTHHIEHEEGGLEVSSTTEQPEIVTYFQAASIIEEIKIKGEGTADNAGTHSKLTEISNKINVISDELNENLNSTIAPRVIEGATHSIISLASNVTEIQESKIEEKDSTVIEVKQPTEEASTEISNLLSTTRFSEKFIKLSPPEEATILPENEFKTVEITENISNQSLKPHPVELENKWQNESNTFQSTVNATTTEPIIEEQQQQQQQRLNEISTFISSVSETSTKGFVFEEPHRDGVITQNFVDRFADYNLEKTKDSTTASRTKTELLETQAVTTNLDKTTESSVMFTTLLPILEKTMAENNMRDNEETTTLQNMPDGIITTTAENSEREESTGVVESSTADYMDETTTPALLARVALKKDKSGILLHTLPISGLQTQNLKVEMPNETSSELTTTIQPIKSIEPSTKTYPQEMVTFIGHTDTTTNRRPLGDETSEVSQTLKPLTLASFMKELQQQIESTTEHVAQTQPATTSVPEEESTEQETMEMETERYSTTRVEETETTVAPIEPEARSLSLPSPKLQYLQSEDGVEVFYGYSIVKHN